MEFFIDSTKRSLTIIANMLIFHLFFQQILKKYTKTLNLFLWKLILKNIWGKFSGHLNDISMLLGTQFVCTKCHLLC
jgi:hypothetical protein